MAQLIYLADDDRDLLDLFSAFLENAGFEVRTFPTGDDLMAAFEGRPADLVVLDIMMPGTDGLTVCRNLRKISDVPIVLLTAKDTELDYMQGLAVGGDDYLMKPFSPSMLVMRVKALLRRVQMDAASSGESAARGRAETLAFGDVRLVPDTHEAFAGTSPLMLTMTEFALMQALLSDAGQPVSRASLLKEVWGFDAEVETRVVDEAVHRVRKKLAAAKSRVAIKAVWGFGYRLENAQPARPGERQ